MNGSRCLRDSSPSPSSSAAARASRAAPPQLHSRGFSEDPKALEPATRKVQEALEALAADKVTDPARIAQSVRRAVGKWVGEVYRRQPMIVPTVLEID